MGSMEIEFIFTYNDDENAPSFLEITEKLIGINCENEFEEAKPATPVSFLNSKNLN